MERGSSATAVIVRPRMIRAALLWGPALLALGACTTNIAGTATYGGPTQTSETTTESTETTEESTSPEETTDLDPDEILACISALFAYDSANDNFIALADSITDGTATDLTPEGVAADFDAAIASVQPVLDPLPAGTIRDSVQAAQTAAAALRDGLRAGTDVSNTELNTALASLSTACEF